MYALKNSANDILQEAFARFSEAGTKLQLRYEELSKETEALRAQLKAKDEELKKSERLALLGETAAALAHEVRNPLGAMRLFLSLLREDSSDKPESLTLIDNIDRSITSLDNVVANILCFSKNGNLEMAPVNVHAIIQEQISHFRLDANTQATFSVTLTGNPFINANEHALRQVFFNLILNALQATKNKGCISVCCSDEGAGVAIEVADNGPGIKTDVIGKVFDPFVTTKNEGTGLGLAIVKQIIIQHQGSISVDNKGGAVFLITLPRFAGNGVEVQES